MIVYNTKGDIDEIEQSSFMKGLLHLSNIDNLLYYEVYFNFSLILLLGKCLLTFFLPYSLFQFIISSDSSNNYYKSNYYCDDEEKEKMCDIVCEAGADYIKTSTGFSTAGANFHDVELMVKGVAGRCKVKAAGGIRTVHDALVYYTLVKEILGKEWLSNELFRIGASRLAPLLLEEITD